MRSVIYSVVLLGLVALPAAQAASDDSARRPLPQGQENNASLKDGEWWSLKPLRRPPLPVVRQTDWARTPIDRFILSRLESAGMRPAPAAERATLIRRLTYDLHGLPPTPAEIDSFVDDARPDALERLVDRLLASPRYGERWGRHWLDLVHYGDTHGYDKDKRRDNAWPYRDYVISSLNEDKPYGQFVKEQIAGDVLEPGSPAGIIATGFIVAGPWDFVGQVELREGTVDKEKTRLVDRDDMVANTMSTFLSLTAQCARCHDHKFDPIPQTDYYRLQAVFAGVERGDRPLADTDARSKAVPPVRLAFAAVPRTPRPIRVLRRGEVERPGQPATPGALACLPGLDPEFHLSEIDNEGRRRLALAQWITDPRNVLAWRSIVNRVWHYHFGRGLVDTPSDFGRHGSFPSHPELLDWLATEFLAKDQSIKELHRLILRSAVYQQSSQNDLPSARIDADNRLLWRMNRQRVDAESLRDSVLAISGKLDRRMGGPGFELFRFKDDHSPIYDHEALEKINCPGAWRRTVYRFVVRSVPNPFLECLDCADPNINTPVRSTTLTALQALALLNDSFMIDQGQHFAERLRGMSGDPGHQIDAAYRLCFARSPHAREQAPLVEYVRKHGLANACRLLWNTNEFVFVD
jgi:Protein of unknown function (DUF1553)/Protein of unknown function (DUF1549)